MRKSNNSKRRRKSGEGDQSTSRSLFLKSTSNTRVYHGEVRKTEIMDMESASGEKG